jgi:hypothetical protein
LQSEGVAVLLGGFSHRPWTVTTGASAGMLAALPDTSEVGASAAELAGRCFNVGFAVVDGLLDWAETAATTHRQTRPY